MRSSTLVGPMQTRPPAKTGARLIGGSLAQSGVVGAKANVRSSALPGTHQAVGVSQHLKLVGLGFIGVMLTVLVILALRLWTV
jgi:hypothetical protein